MADSAAVEVLGVGMAWDVTEGIKQEGQARRGEGRR